MKVTTLFPTNPTIEIGDRVRLNGDTNRTRRKVSKRFNSTSFELETFIRPSRGYARHIRRKKANKR